MKTGIIYIYTHNLSNKKYIGQTFRPLQRKIEHKSCAKLSKDHTYFHNAINKYGWENFRYEVLEFIVEETQEEAVNKLNEAEKYWISHYKTNNKE